MSVLFSLPMPWRAGAFLFAAGFFLFLGLGAFFALLGGLSHSKRPASLAWDFGCFLLLPVVQLAGCLCFLACGFYLILEGVLLHKLRAANVTLPGFVLATGWTLGSGQDRAAGAVKRCGRAWKQAVQSLSKGLGSLIGASLLGALFAFGLPALLWFPVPGSVLPYGIRTAAFRGYYSLERRIFPSAVPSTPFPDPPPERPTRGGAPSLDPASEEPYRSEPFGVTLAYPRQSVVNGLTYRWQVLDQENESPDASIVVRADAGEKIASFTLTRYQTQPDYEQMRAKKRALFGYAFQDDPPAATDFTIQGVAYNSLHWRYREPTSDGRRTLKIQRFLFNRDGVPWEVRLLAYAEDYNDFGPIFNRIIDSLTFN